jgi:subtilisin family serine protease
MRVLRIGAVIAAATVVTALAAATPAAAGGVAVARASGPSVRPIPNAYIVQLAPGTDARGLARALGVAASDYYEHAVNGFAATLTPGQLNALRYNKAVQAISQDAWLDSATEDTQLNPPAWGIDRIDQANLPLSNSYTYTSTGTGIHAYVIDTGIDVTHPAFGGRASFDHNAIGGPNTDCDGHGTHVAGTIGSDLYGVAKNVRLHAVKILNCAGSGKTSKTIAGIDWVTANSVKPAVANTSWNWTYNSTLATALTNMMNSGVFLASSAGNTGADSCDRLPRNLTAALVVAATESNDNRASYSSIGTCVDVYGPGSGILSTQPNNSTAVFSGTSMATPHAAGIAVLYKATFGDASQATVAQWIINNATAGVVQGNLSGTPNLLVRTTL